MKYRKELSKLVREAWTKEPPDPIKWAEEFVKFPSSARSTSFDCSITPWIREPIYRAAYGLWRPEVDQDVGYDFSVPANLHTLKKPVQSGGSAFGEVMLEYWIMFARGFVQYNWTDNEKAKDRWESRIEAVLNANKLIAAKIEALGQNEANKCEIDFGNVFFRMQGAFKEGNLDSDSVPFQINEEVHAWEPGHLAKARARATAVWNSCGIDISNAGIKDDQLAKAFDGGTQQRWLVWCPGCSKFHYMHTRWDNKRPDLGGLRYDGDKARRPGGSYDYNIIRSTLRYQMPCGYEVPNDTTARKALSESGKYSEPVPGSDLTHRSYTYEAVTVDYIDWVLLVKEKHEALRALRLGDPEPWRKYRVERECIDYDPNENPMEGSYTILTPELKKNRDGLPGEKLRLFNLDRQQGERARGEFPHWWLTIRDYQVWTDPADSLEKLRSMLVFEGKVETNAEVIAILKAHQCNMWHGVADSGDDTTEVYLFCLEHGINAIKGGSKNGFYTHPNGARRIYSPERPLHLMLNRPPKYPYVALIKEGKRITMPDPREPLFWLYSKFGIRERFHWVRTMTVFLTPEDVSEEYQLHMDSEVREVSQHPTEGYEIVKYVQKRKRNDLYVCECYGTMQLDMAGYIMKPIETKELENENTGLADGGQEFDQRGTEQTGSNGWRSDSNVGGGKV